MCGISWARLFYGSIIGALYTLYIMHNTVTTFEKASGMGAIVLFFVQTMALLLIDRRAEIVGLLHTFNLNFLKPGYGGEGSQCVIPGGFYAQWLFGASLLAAPSAVRANPAVPAGIFSTPALMLLVYLTVILMTTLTSEAMHIQTQAKLVLRDHRTIHIIDNVLKKQAIFKHVPDKFRLAVATEMIVKTYKEDVDVYDEGSIGFDFFVITKGSCSLRKGGGQLAVNGVRRAGECFGEDSLVHDTPRIHTVKTLEEVDVAVLSRDKFAELEQRLQHNKQFMKDLHKINKDFRKTLEVEASSRELADGAEGVADAADDGSGSAAPGDAAATDAPVSDPESMMPSMEMEEKMESETGSTKEDADTLLEEEAEHIAGRIFVSTFRRDRALNKQLDLKSREISQLEEQHETRLVDTKKCGGLCGKLGNLLYRVGKIALGDFYTACHDPTARKCATLEIPIALYGPLTQHLLGIFICGEDPLDREREVLALDPTIICSGASYSAAWWLSFILTPVVVVGVPLYMVYASMLLSQKLDQSVEVHEDTEGKGKKKGAFSKQLMHEAEISAQAFFVSSWNTFDDARKQEEIEKFAHNLQVEEMSNSCYLLSKFQMSMNQKCEAWYPLWYMLRRIVLNFIYIFSKATAVDGELSVTDYRVGSMLLLATSSVLQYHYHPFRRLSENKL